MIQSRILKIVCFIFFVCTSYATFANDNTPRKITVNEKTSVASGFFVTDDGYLVTAYHAIANFNEIIVFGHNPSLHKLSQNLTNSIIYEFPTCSAFCIKFDIENWSDLNNGQKEFFLYPSLF